jgi:spore coat polysaccharide biosynthesis protein SpsF
MNVVATVEARMSSTRLPAKTMMQVAGKPILELVIERLQSATLVNHVVVATTTNPRDDLIVSFCEENSIDVHRGSESDVLRRVFETAQKFSADIIVQAGADCPFYDPGLVDELIRIFKGGTYDYVANDMLLTYPEGVDAHVMSMKVLSEIQELATKPRDRDDVPRYIWNHPERYRIFNLEAPPDLRRPEIRLTLDYPEDLILTQKIYDVLYTKNPHFTTRDVIMFLDKNPELLTINANCKQLSAAYLP